MRARPSRHTRTIRTKRGMKTVMVNPGIRKRKPKKKLQWYCNCTEDEKCAECQRNEPIVEQMKELERSASRKTRKPERKEYKFSGKYGSWKEEHEKESDAKMRAQSLNVALTPEEHRKRQIQRGIRRKSFDEDESSDWPFIEKPTKEKTPQEAIDDRREKYQHLRRYSHTKKRRN